MTGVYNKFQDDGLILDEKRALGAFAIDVNTTLPKLKTFITAEWAWINVNVPSTHATQFGSKQSGGFVDIVQPVFKKPLWGFPNSTFNVACRVERVDWNVGTFAETGTKIYDELFSVMPAISWRPIPSTVIRFNYRIQRQWDILGNPPAKTGAFQLGISSYF